MVVEPATDPAAPGADALAAEAVRLAGALEAGLACVTWPAEPPAALEQVADALAGLVQATQPAAVLLLDTDAGRQLAPMVAQRCGSGAVTGCSDVVVREQPGVAGGDPPRRTLTFVKPVFGGWLEREVDAVAGGAPVATLDLTGAEPAGALAAGAFPEPQVLEIDAAAASRVRHLELIPPDARSVDLVHARRIVAAGSGVASDELLDAVRELADLLEGSVGATRPMTDDGRLPKERLIGQTGRSVSPGALPRPGHLRLAAPRGRRAQGRPRPLGQPGRARAHLPVLRRRLRRRPRDRPSGPGAQDQRVAR